MLRINHILLLLILLASHMDSQIIALWLCSFLPAPPQDHEPTISSTISLPICEPVFIPPTLYRNPPMGPTPFISFSRQFFPPWGTHFTLGHPFLYLYIYPQKLFIIYYLLYKHLYFQSLHSFSFIVGDLISFCHTQPMSPLAGALLIIYPRRHRPYLQSTPRVSYPYPLNLFTLSRPWHNLAPVLSSP
jgi:hypothetical protein